MNVCSGDVLVRMMDEQIGDTCKTLFGHGGPVYHLSFSPDRNLLLSSAEDSTGNKNLLFVLN